MKYDIIIIGAGPGGYETAVAAAKAGLQVAIVEKNALGGTCLNVGCIPTKCLCRNAEFLLDLAQADAFGVEAGPAAFDLAKAIDRKDAVVEQLRGGVEVLLAQPGITRFEGKAYFRDAHAVGIEGSDEVLEAPNIIIATGSETKFLPIEGAHHPRVLTSTEMLSLRQLPKSLAVIGGGVIGMEFASIFNAFGTHVSVLEYCKEILPFFDRDMAKRLRTALKKRGIEFHVGAAVCGVRDSENGLADVLFEEKGAQASLEAEVVLMAVGRAANVGSLNLADVGIATERRGITTDDNLQTSVPGIYAIGDVNGRIQLAHAATFQGKRALNHILGRPDQLQLDLCPAAVFTTPELAMVGQTEEQLKADGTDYRAEKAFYRANGKALAMGEGEGIVKLLVAPDDRLLGAHILGAHAADLIHEATLLMQLGGTLSQMRQTIHAHPSLSELFV